MAIHPIITQTFFYAIVMALTFGFLGLTQKGFFWKYLKVKLSFGKLVLVKLRAINRDYFSIGSIEEGFLVFKDNKKEEKRISIKDSKPLYRVMGTNWIDLSDQKNAVCMPDYSVVDGFDAAKYNNLYVRALYKPVIASNQEKIIVALIIGSCLLTILVAYLVYMQGQRIDILFQAIESVKSVTKTAFNKIPI